METTKNIILIAEDDDTSFLLIEAVLAGIDCELIRVYTGKDAVSIFNKHSNISLILMDMKMPVMDGSEATIEIRKQNKEIPIIAQTAFALAGDKEKALNSGCNDYISKPINRDEFIKKVGKYLK